MRFLIFSFVLVSLLTSCNGSQKIYFNKDWSGSAETLVDFSSMFSMMGSEEIPDLATDSANVAKIEKLKKIPGISKVDVSSSDKSKLLVKYDFSNIEALNLSGNLIYGDNDFVKDKYFEVVNNELTFTFPHQEEGADMGMGDQFIYNLDISSKRKLKNVESNCNEIEKSSNGIKLKTNLTELTQDGVCKTIKIKFK
jgi:hypothetical protein